MSDRIHIQQVVSEAEDGMRLSTFLKRKMSISRRMMKKLKPNLGSIEVNQQHRHLNSKLQAGEKVAIDWTEQSETSDILPQPIPIDVLFEDDSLLVVNKPPGYIVHPTTGHYLNTLANGIVHMWAERGEQRIFRPAHRLDQDTSGVWVVAKNGYVHQQLSLQQLDDTWSKLYVAWVWGVPPGLGIVDAPIARDQENFTIRCVADDGLAAQTEYRCLDTWRHDSWPAPISQVHLRLITGRTHQIRVHMAHCGWPLLGDPIYGRDEEPEWTGSRQALHAEKAMFIHPLTREKVTFQAPLPDDLLNLQQFIMKEGEHP